MMEDYKLEYELERELKARKLKFEILELQENAYRFDVVLTDCLSGNNCVLCFDAKECIRKLQSFFYGKSRFEKLVVGIDPGPMPGVAVVGDGNVVEEIQLSAVEEVRSLLDSIKKGYSPEHLIVRIGDGDIINRNRIINSLVEDYVVEMVNEENTSEAISNRNVEAAKVIAFSRGKRIKTRLNVVLTDGYIREIQRKSRIESDGMLTISRELARKVALGKMSLREAIEEARNGQ